MEHRLMFEIVGGTALAFFALFILPKWLILGYVAVKSPSGMTPEQIAAIEKSKADFADYEKRNEEANRAFALRFPKAQRQQQPS